MIIFISQIIAYLIGGIPFGYVIARAVAGIDIREHGSGNIGATNCGRVLGLRYFFLVFLLDFLKGALPVLLAQYIAAAPERVSLTSMEVFGLPVAVGFAAILGHMFPVYLGLRGGKGVATSIGVISILAPIPAVIGVSVWLLAVALTAYISVGSLLFAATFAASYLLLADDPFAFRELPMLLFVASVVILVTFGHRENIVRLVNGTEARVKLPWKKA